VKRAKNREYKKKSRLKQKMIELEVGSTNLPDPETFQRKNKKDFPREYEAALEREEGILIDIDGIKHSIAAIEKQETPFANDPDAQETGMTFRDFFTGIVEDVMEHGTIDVIDKSAKDVFYAAMNARIHLGKDVS